MVGIDLIEVARIEFSESFMNRIANESEIEYIKKSKCESLQKQRLASLFCVKEAVVKALGTGVSKGVTFKEIILFHDENGKPFVELMGNSQQIFNDRFYGKHIHISISHTENYATAIAMIN